MFITKIIAKIKGYLQKIHEISLQVKQIKITLNKLQESLGRIENRQLQNIKPNNIIDCEFQVYSQWGEDGIIQLILQHTEIKRKVFIEFGVENYTESNTRFLLVNNNWSGLVIDGSKENIQHIKNDPIYWKHNLKAVHSFVTQDNINQIFRDNGIVGDIGLLSIDIDGNDYWIWDAINVVNPAIVIIEYNHRFGKENAVTIPYQEDFVRSQAHHSMIYYGASLKSINLIAQRKGYAFVGCCSSGVNAFFVRQELKPDFIPEITIDQGYIAGKFRESRDFTGQLSYLSSTEEQELLKSLPLIKVE